MIDFIKNIYTVDIDVNWGQKWRQHPKEIGSTVLLGEFNYGTLLRANEMSKKCQKNILPWEFFFPDQHWFPPNGQPLALSMKP